MLRVRLQDALKTATLARDRCATATLRLLLAALKDREIAKRSESGAQGLNDAEIMGLLQSMIKQREESIRLFEQGGRKDLAAEEAAEIEVIRKFLPPQMSAEEIEVAVADVVEALQALTLKDMGRVMTALKQRFSGRMDPAKASAAVKKRLC